MATLSKVIIISLVTAILTAALIYYSSFITNKKQFESVKAGQRLEFQHSMAKGSNALISQNIQAYNEARADVDSRIMIMEMTARYKSTYTIMPPLED